MEELHPIKKEMKGLHDVAWASYHAAPQNMKDEVDECFNKMDSNGDGKVNLQEFLDFTKKEGLSEMSNPQFFEDLIVRDGHDHISFGGVVTFYYILVSKRPHCNSCRNFIKETFFFTCRKCFHCKRTSFNICLSCFLKPESYEHEHKDQLMDNVLLLQTISKKPECQCCEASPQAMAMKSQPAAGTSNEIDPYNPNNLLTSQQAMNSQSSAETSNQIAPDNNSLASPQEKTMKSQPSAGTSNESVPCNPNNPRTSQQAINSQSSAETSSQIVQYNPNNSLASPQAKTMKLPPSAGTSNKSVPCRPNNPGTSQQAINSQSSAETNSQIVQYNPNNSLVRAGIIWSIGSSVANIVAAIAGCSIM